MMKRSREEGKKYRRNLPFQSDAMARKIMNKLLNYFVTLCNTGLNEISSTNPSLLRTTPRGTRLKRSLRRQRRQGWRENVRAAYSHLTRTPFAPIYLIGWPLNNENCHKESICKHNVVFTNKRSQAKVSTVYFFYW